MNKLIIILSGATDFRPELKAMSFYSVNQVLEIEDTRILFLVLGDLRFLQK